MTEQTANQTINQPQKETTEMDHTNDINIPFDEQVSNGLDFNNAPLQQFFNLIPRGTVAKVVMHIKPGGYSDPARGWTGGYATCRSSSETVYLNCEFTILEGPYAKHKVWSLIGLYSPKGPEWANMGRAFIRAILNSAHGFAEKDDSPEALAARHINGYGDLNGVEFFARIDVKEDKQTGLPKNIIRMAVMKGHKGYGGDEETHASSQDGVSAPLPIWAR